MSNAQYLIDYIQRVIPKEILQAAFCSPRLPGQIPLSIDRMILDQIIVRWVLADLNLISGQEVHIDLSLCPTQSLPGGTLFHIPQSATLGKEITSVLSVSHGYGTPGSNQNPANGLSTIQKPITTRAYITAPNALFVEGTFPAAILWARVVIAHDNDLGDLSPRALPLLAELTEQAAKAYVYNELIIRIDSAATQSGVTLSSLASIVESYSDALQLYTEMKNTKWRPSSILHDPVSKRRHITRQMPR